MICIVSESLAPLVDKSGRRTVFTGKDDISGGTTLEASSCQ